MMYGYARCSSNGQDLASQLEALKKAGAVKIYSEKVSGMKTDRPQFTRLLNALEADDIIIVTHLDRISRSTPDLLNKLDLISKKNAKFKSLNETWADTTTPMGNLITTIMSGFAQFNREMILKRCDEGRKVAKQRGVRFGRKPKLTEYQIKEAKQRKADGETLTAIARSFNVSHSTISRL